MTEVRLELRDVTKDFDGQRALDRVDLRVAPGTIHALLGANGSGKSTLIKVLAGVHRPEPGSTVEVRGVRIEPGSARASHAAGIRFIHQDLGLVDELDIAENLALGSGAENRWWVSSRQEWQRAEAVLRKHGVELDPRRLVASLRPAEKSMVAIVRAVEDGLDRTGILVLDEPTAALPPHEVEHLMRLLVRLRDGGVSILYVTHRLSEVFEIADTVTVLRDGQLVATEPVAQVEVDRLLELILGRVPDERRMNNRPAPGNPVLEVAGLTSDSVLDVDFSIAAGEVVGVAGLMGSGHDAVLEAVFGAVPLRRGSVRIAAGEPACPSPRWSLAHGVVYAPAERRERGAMLDWTLRENVTLPSLRSKGIGRRIAQRAEVDDALHWLRRLGVKPLDTEARFGSFSGGNQQKVVVGRWLRCDPHVLLLAEPTIGVDAGAKVAIYEELRSAAAAGAGVVVSSSDAEEIATLCDRVLVFSRGCIVAELRAPMSPEAVAAACLQGSPPAARDNGIATHHNERQYS